MKLTIVDVGKGWKPSDAPPTFKPIYTLTTMEFGEPIKTMDPALTTPGEHNAEEYASTSGKKYWRSVGGTTAPQTRLETPSAVFTPKGDSDPTRTSIERQKAADIAANIINSSITTDDLTVRLLEFDVAFEAVLKHIQG